MNRSTAFKNMKIFNVQQGIGKAKYVVNYHDGHKKHRDGSNFFDIAIFKNKKKLERFLSILLNNGYVDSPPRFNPNAMKCQYSVGCKNKATTSIPHPILGQVPCCEKCKAFVARIKAEVSRRRNPGDRRSGSLIQNGYEYLTIVVRTYDDLKRAERLHAAGWKNTRLGIDTLQFYRKVKRYPRRNAQQQRVSGVATKVAQEGSWMVVRYHGTPVVRFNTTVGRVSLQSGGWMSATTKTRMNQAANQWNIPIRVVQKSGKWIITTPSGDFPYADGIELAWDNNNNVTVTGRRIPLEI